jgi:putative ABC transport system substrate-binding protein
MARTPKRFFVAALPTLIAFLRGARPQDLPVEQPLQVQPSDQLKTAKALGLTIPVKLLTVADEVIE